MGVLINAVFPHFPQCIELNADLITRAVFQAHARHSVQAVIALLPAHAHV